VIRYSIFNRIPLNRFKILKKLYLTFFLLLSILTIGIIGFILIEGYTVQEAFYMTVITLSTVGFMEVRPLSSVGQLFTSLLIITSFGTFAYGITVITRSVFSGELAFYYKRYRLESSIKKISSHVIVCGFGRNGRRAAKKLEAYGQKYVVVESDPQIVEEYLLSKGIPHVQGDATNDQVLNDAGIDKAKSIITTLSKDADNLYVVISARSLNKDIYVISRASNESAEKKLKAVGANSVVMPEGVGGAHMATLVMSPNIVEFLDHISVEGSSSINLEEIEVRQITGSLDSLLLKDLALRQKTGCTIIGLKTPEGEYVINPGGDMKITPHSKLFVLGKPEEIKGLYKFLNE